MQIRPLHDRVLIRRLDSEEKTSGGIIIPDTAQEKPMEGEVVAAGDGARGENGQIQPLLYTDSTTGHKRASRSPFL